MPPRSIADRLAAHAAAMQVLEREHPDAMPAAGLRDAALRLQQLLAEVRRRGSLTPLEEQALATAYVDLRRALGAIEAQRQLRVLDQKLTGRGYLSRGQRILAARAVRSVRAYAGWWTYRRCLRLARELLHGAP